MPPHIQLRRLTQSGLPFADTVRSLAGWNQTLKDWQALIQCEPEGCFLAELDGAPAGTVTTTCYERDLAWIGMLIVHPEKRSLGVGRALMQKALDYLRQRQVQCIKLDATPAGRPLYERMGFRLEWALARWKTGIVFASGHQNDRGLAAFDGTATAVIAGLDRRAFGANRLMLLEQWRASGACLQVNRTADGHMEGYGLLRQGSCASYLGPVVAESPQTADLLVRTLLAEARQPKIFWDIPEPNHAAADLARRLGFAIQRPLFRMYLETNSAPGDPLLQFGIGDPSTG